MSPTDYVYKKPLVRFAMWKFDRLGHLFLGNKPRPPQRVQRIALIALHQIGDIVISTPTFAAFRNMYPDAHITVICGTSTAPVLENNPWGLDVITFDATWNAVVAKLKDTKEASHETAEARLLRIIKDLKPDIAVVFFPDLRVNHLLAKSMIPYTTGFANAGGGFWLSQALPMPDSGNQVERTFSLATSAAKAFQQPTPKLAPPKLMVSPSEIKEAHEWLKAHTIKPDRLVVIHPFGSAETKNWGPTRWATVITWLKDHNYCPVIIGGKNDRFSDASAHITTDATVACGQFTLRQSMAIMSLCRLFIGVDSGPGHIAAALGKPVVSIFSSVNRPERWAPYGPKSRIRVMHSPVTNRQHFPYELTELPPTTLGNPYTDGISAHDVTTAIEELLTSAASPTKPLP